MNEVPSKWPQLIADSLALKTTARYPGLSSDTDTDFIINTSPLPPLFGRYQRISFIGRGGFGEVWRAFDPDLDCYVAIKTPRTDRHFPENVIEEFLSEARKLAKLRDCPGVMTVFDVGNENGFAYIVSELLEGGCLETVLRDQPLPHQDAVRFLAQIAESLHQAHLKGLVHRDLKPANILFTKNGTPTIVDFGLAVSEKEQLSETHGTLGTMAYMSPEQAAGNSRLANAQSDIYSLGVMLYFMLTLRLPFVANTWREYREQLLHRPPRPLRTIDDRISPEVERICLKCLAKNPEDRYTTAADLARELQASLGPPPEPMRSRLWRPMGMVAVLTMVVAAVVVSWAWNSMKPPSGPQQLPPLADPPPRGLVESHWINGMGQAPKELIWPGYRGSSTHGFDERHGVFAVTSNHMRFYKLGEIPQTDCRLAIEMHQPIHTGGFGIFLGFHIAPVQRVDQARFQLIWLGTARTRVGGTAFQMKREKASIFPSSGNLFAENEFGYQRVGSASLDGSTRLELHIKNRQIVKILWGKTDLTELVSPAIEKHLGPTDYANWGVFQEGGTTWFREPLLAPLDNSEKE